MKSSEDIIKDVKADIANLRSLVSKVDAILNNSKQEPVNRYSMSILVNGQGITVRFTEEDAYIHCDGLVNLLMKAGISDIVEGSYAEFASATLANLIGSMEGDYLEISGKEVRYKVPQLKVSKRGKESWSLSSWRYLADNVVVEIYKLPLTNNDYAEAKEKENELIVEALTQQGLLAELIGEIK